jgi:CrcB protein
MPIAYSFLFVFIGSGLGGMLRHAVGLASLRIAGPNFPWGTLIINVVGSALMGLVVGVFSARHITSSELRLFLTTGIIGGFTTWSTFSLDVVVTWERGQPLAAIGYVAASLILSLVLLSAIMIAMRRWG